ncbi:hypothetical protein H0H81_010280 [Sphagnurus paluster]|uniref:Uncharacterized protein n=1 Tax=Sphagnurus paluster TaxID=117069 RepID=A0A9P7GVJ3_9AGAR|nr:hypothetical protein H0H81_010280 [Sphagnurus paluster]
MSSEEANTAVIVNGELSVSVLAAALKGTHSAEAHHVFSAEESKSSAVATEADWAKFWAAANKIKVRPTLLLDSPEVSPAAAATVIAAIALAVQIADVLWNIFKGFDDKEGRSKWTAQVVGDSRRENPHFNWVIVYTNHSINFQGIRDVDWSVRSVRYGLKVGYIT